LAINKRSYLLAGILIGASFGVHGIGIFVYLPFLFIHYQLNKSHRLKDIFIFNKYFIITNITIFCFIPLLYFLNQYGFKNYFNLALNGSSVGSGIWHIMQGKAISTLKGVVYYIKTLWEYEPVIFLFFVPGLLSVFLKDRRAFYLIASFVFPYFLYISSASIFTMPRYLAPVIPFLALAISYFLYNAIDSIIKNGILKKILVAIFCLVMIYLPLLWLFSLTKPSSRLGARDWIYGHVAENSKLLTFGRPVMLNENSESLRFAKNLDNFYFSSRQNYLLTQMREDELPRPYYFIVASEDYPDIPRKINDVAFDYVLVAWWNNDERSGYLEDLSEYGIGKIDLIKRIPADATDNSFNLEVAQRTPKPLINLPRVKFVGPIIDVYKIEKTQDE